ncbi:50S ribosomal protein L4 [Candidatus Woesearchaeota archaeon]|nr:50S ribosomal protein L4 [Candidatus Woesearchaeota archaeon]
MKEVMLFNVSGQKSTLKLPAQFDEIVRPDVIRRAVHVLQSVQRQRYGTDPRAGKRVSAKLSKRRRNYRGSYGHGISRIPRKIMSRRGRHFNWVGAMVPQAIGGMRAHPPKADKCWAQKMNVKQRRKAIRSAMAATLFRDIVENRGHKIPEQYPFVAEGLEDLKKTKDVHKALSQWGFAVELAKCKKRNERAGRAKTRGRRRKVRKGPLLVVDDTCSLQFAARNIAGIDIATVKSLNAALLAPGGQAGRATIFTKKAIDKIAKENLFQ